MLRECAFILPGGRKCRAAANRHQALCRHHLPQPAVPGPPPKYRRDAYSRHNRWTQLGRSIPWIEPSRIPREAFAILEALMQDGPFGVSDRVAGRLLRGLLRRLGDIPFVLAGAVHDRPSPVTSNPVPASRGVSRPAASRPAATEPAVFDPAVLDALLAALTPSETQPHVPQMQPHVPHMQPDPRHMQPDLRHTQPSCK